ncbi:NAD(P)-dependent oxidoreductase [Pseudomonas sp. NPDC007930]|uniref:NAD(P)-dependent oxidoreductase n=1 Tax=Pseudomonas sp. NPDC007930 TaxID=3364417 RepID=UPI0036E6A5F7
MSVIASQLPAADNALLRARLPGHEVIDLATGAFSAEHAEVLILRPLNVRGQRLDHAPPGWPWSLRWVQLVSSGIDYYPAWLFGEVPVSSGRGSNAEQVAEFALAAIFAAAKQLPGLWVKDDQWRFSPLQPVRGSTLGILGFGSIGQALAAKALALGMRVLAHGRPGQPLAEVPGVSAAASLEALFQHSDHLVLAAPLTAHTRGLVGARLLSQAKPGLHLINIARGALLDQQALLAALERGLLSRATLDVTEPEPLPAGHPLYQHPRVFISPHTSALSSDGLAGFVEAFAGNFERFSQGQALHNLVDPQRGY